MAHNHGSGGAMVMTAGVPGLFYMQQIFWSFIGAAIATAVIVNVFNKILFFQRIYTSKKTPDAARPRSWFFQSQATMAAVIREYSYYSLPISLGKVRWYILPTGSITMIVGYAVLIVVCSLYRLNPKDLLQWEDIGYRAGFIAVAQLPLIVLLAGKRNIIGYLVGMGYERLNWLHRWTARCLLLTVLIHAGFWLNEWGKFDYITIKFQTDALTQRGVAAGTILLWLVLSSMAPIRGLAYQFFIVQHIISWLGFFVAVYFHVPEENRIWLWLSLSFFAFDRLVRNLMLLYSNINLRKGRLACKATFEALDDHHTRITIPSPPIRWKAGQHIFFTCHSLAPLSSHPFTIASLPQDGKIELIVRSKKGATRRFHKYASKPESCTGRTALVEGPYSQIRPLRQFDSVVFIAGSTGATFTVPLLRDLVVHWTHDPKPHSWSLEPSVGAVTRHIRFIWVIKRRSSLDWFSAHLSDVMNTTENLRKKGIDVTVEISIYITCDDTFTSEKSSLRDTLPASSRQSFDTTEKKIVEETVELASQSDTAGCCCTRTITDEDTIAPPCCCSSSSSPSSTPQPQPQAPTPPCNDIIISEPPIPAHDPLTILAGRPHVRNLIRKSAEQALGEMAVVVCGPPGLVQGVRNAVGGVSDERAVHKGTGAQGIWCHAESLGYA